MKLQITQDDIDNGIPLHSDRCPIVLALHRHFDNRYKGFLVDTVEVLARNPIRLLGWPLTNAQTFIEKFDANEPVEPCEVEIRLLNESAD